MRDIIETAIDREVELLDAILELPGLIEHSLFSAADFYGRLRPQTRNFSTRGISPRRRFSRRTAPAPKYLN